MLGKYFYVDIFLDGGAEGGVAAGPGNSTCTIPQIRPAKNKKNENMFMMVRIGKALSAVINHFVL